MSRYQRQFGNAPALYASKEDTPSNSALRARKLASLRAEAEALDERFGFEDFSWEAIATL